MLPFLKNKKAQSTGVVVQDLSPSQPIESKDENITALAMEACAQNLLDAVAAKDTKAIADALSNAFCIMEAAPQDDESTVEPHSYEAQNQKAYLEESE